jgi:hypothetical protein
MLFFVLEEVSRGNGVLEGLGEGGGANVKTERKNRPQETSSDELALPKAHNPLPQTKINMKKNVTTLFKKRGLKNRAQF